MQRRDFIHLSLLSAAPLALTSRAFAGQTAADPAPVPDARTTAPLPVPASGEIRVAFLIAEGAEIVDFGGPWGVFEYVFVDGPRRNPFSLYTVAATKDPVTASGGMVILPNHSIADAPKPHIVSVPAMMLDKLAPEALDWLRRVHETTDITMSVCNGSYVLAKAGLLDGRTATAHHGGYGGLRAMFPKVNVVRGRRWVEDGRVATSGGLTSGQDLALRVVERYYGRDIAKKTARSLEYQGTGWMHPNSNAEFAQRPVATAERPVCPVCDTQIARKTALTVAYKGNDYLLCSDWCKGYFVKTPERFIAT